MLCGKKMRKYILLYQKDGALLQTRHVEFESTRPAEKYAVTELRLHNGMYDTISVFLLRSTMRLPPAPDRSETNAE